MLGEKGIFVSERYIKYIWKEMLYLCTVLKSVIFWPEITSFCLQIEGNQWYYMFLLSFFLSQISSAFCVQLFAQWDKKSAITVSKYSKLSGKPEESLQNDTMGDLATEQLLPALTRIRGYQRRRRGCSAVINVSAFDIIQPQSWRCWLWWISGDSEVGVTLDMFVWYLVYTLVQGR